MNTANKLDDSYIFLEDVKDLSLYNWKGSSQETCIRKLSNFLGADIFNIHQRFLFNTDPNVVDPSSYYILYGELEPNGEINGVSKAPVKIVVSETYLSFTSENVPQDMSFWVKDHEGTWYELLGDCHEEYREIFQQGLQQLRAFIPTEKSFGRLEFQLDEYCVYDERFQVATLHGISSGKLTRYVTGKLSLQINHQVSSSSFKQSEQKVSINCLVSAKQCQFELSTVGMTVWVSGSTNVWYTALRPAQVYISSHEDLMKTFDSSTYEVKVMHFYNQYRKVQNFTIYDQSGAIINGPLPTAKKSSSKFLLVGDLVPHAKAGGKILPIRVTIVDYCFDLAKKKTELPSFYYHAQDGMWYKAINPSANRVITNAYCESLIQEYCWPSDEEQMWLHVENFQLMNNKNQLCSMLITNKTPKPCTLRGELVMPKKSASDTSSSRLKFCTYLETYSVDFGKSHLDPNRGLWLEDFLNRWFKVHNKNFNPEYETMAKEAIRNTEIFLSIYDMLLHGPEEGSEGYCTYDSKGNIYNCKYSILEVYELSNGKIDLEYIVKHKDFVISNITACIDDDNKISRRFFQSIDSLDLHEIEEAKKKLALSSSNKANGVVAPKQGFDENAQQPSLVNISNVITPIISKKVNKAAEENLEATPSVVPPKQSSTEEVIKKIQSSLHTSASTSSIIPPVSVPARGTSSSSSTASRNDKVAEPKTTKKVPLATSSIVPAVGIDKEKAPSTKLDTIDKKKKALSVCNYCKTLKKAPACINSKHRDGYYHDDPAYFLDKQRVPGNATVAKSDEVFENNLSKSYKRKESSILETTPPVKKMKLDISIPADSRSSSLSSISSYPSVTNKREYDPREKDRERERSREREMVRERELDRLKGSHPPRSSSSSSSSSNGWEPAGRFPHYGPPNNEMVPNWDVGNRDSNSFGRDYVPRDPHDRERERDRQRGVDPHYERSEHDSHYSSSKPLIHRSNSADREKEKPLGSPKKDPRCNPRYDMYDPTNDSLCVYCRRLRKLRECTNEQHIDGHTCPPAGTKSSSTFFPSTAPSKTTSTSSTTSTSTTTVAKPATSQFKVYESSAALKVSVPPPTTMIHTSTTIPTMSSISSSSSSSVPSLFTSFTTSSSSMMTVPLPTSSPSLPPTDVIFGDLSLPDRLPSSNNNNNDRRESDDFVANFAKFLNRDIDKISRFPHHSKHKYDEELTGRTSGYPTITESSSLATTSTDAIATTTTTTTSTSSMPPNVVPLGRRELRPFARLKQQTQRHPGIYSGSSSSNNISSVKYDPLDKHAQPTKTVLRRGFTLNEQGNLISNKSIDEVMFEMEHFPSAASTTKKSLKWADSQDKHLTILHPPPSPPNSPEKEH